MTNEDAGVASPNRMTDRCVSFVWALEVFVRPRMEGGGGGGGGDEEGFTTPSKRAATGDGGAEAGDPEVSALMPKWWMR